MDPNLVDDVGQTLLNWSAAFGTNDMVQVGRPGRHFFSGAPCERRQAQQSRWHLTCVRASLLLPRLVPLRVWRRPRPRRAQLVPHLRSVLWPSADCQNSLAVGACGLCFGHLGGGPSGASEYSKRHAARYAPRSAHCARSHLFSFGADPTLTDEGQKTALERAKEKPTSGHREVERILENPDAFRGVRTGWTRCSHLWPACATPFFLQISAFGLIRRRPFLPIRRMTARRRRRRPAAVPTQAAT